MTTETVFAARRTAKSTQTHFLALPSVTWPQLTMMHRAKISTKCPDLQSTFPTTAHQTTSRSTTTRTTPAAPPPGTSPRRCKPRAPMAPMRNLSAPSPAQPTSKFAFPTIHSASAETASGRATSPSAASGTAAQTISESTSTSYLTLRLPSRSATSTTFGSTSAVSSPQCPSAWTAPESVSSPTTTRYELDLLYINRVDRVNRVVL